MGKINEAHGAGAGSTVASTVAFVGILDIFGETRLPRLGSWLGVSFFFFLFRGIYGVAGHVDLVPLWFVFVILMCGTLPRTRGLDVSFFFFLVSWDLWCGWAC